MLFGGVNNLGMAVPEVQRGVRAEHVKKRVALRVVDHNPFGAFNDHLFGFVIGRAVFFRFIDDVPG
ncbi:hypothetical protein SDC9_179285 [bioreactor metagenome]|uniref:Uncharacterized protein n=1 Tax=bioreactor metagenome TaxID=1076179 RepID=A0A645GZG9_9ZZZZ